MPPPRVTIDELPLKADPEDTDLIVLQDLGGTKRSTVGAIKGDASADLTAHIDDPTGAHAASAISATDSGGGVNGTTVQAQLGQLVTTAAGAASDAAAATAGLAAHLADAVDAHDASAVSFIPAAGLAATQVQAAIEEVSNGAIFNFLNIQNDINALESTRLTSVVAGAGISVNSANPLAPIITATGGGGGGGGSVDEVVAGDGITVDDTDPTAPIVSAIPAMLPFDAGGNASAARPAVSATVVVLWTNVPSEPTNLGPFDMWEDPSGGSGSVSILPFDAEGNASAARPAVSTTTIVLWTNTPSEPVNLGPFDMWEDIP